MSGCTVVMNSGEWYSVVVYVGKLSGGCVEVKLWMVVDVSDGGKSVAMKKS